MKKSWMAAGLAAALCGIMSGCASNKTSAADEPVSPEEIVVVGNYEEDDSRYVMDLAKVTTPGEEDSVLVLNDDGSLTVTYLGNYSQILVPVPYNDPKFKNMTQMIVTVTSDFEGQKKFVTKLSKDAESSWGGSGGPDGQGKNCIGYSYRDYEGEWDEEEVTVYFNGDTYSFSPLSLYKNMKAVALCNNTTPAPFTFTIHSIIWSK